MEQEKTYEEALEYYANEGICLWCNGTKEITHDAGKDTEWTEKCPVCNMQEEDPDSYKDNLEDR